MRVVLESGADAAGGMTDVLGIFASLRAFTVARQPWPNRNAIGHVVRFETAPAWLHLRVHGDSEQTQLAPLDRLARTLHRCEARL